jgi:3-phosphoglycerate kinase
VRTVRDIEQLSGRAVLVRCDFDVPVGDGTITEDFRIVQQRENLQWLVSRGARIVMVAHISAVPSFEPLLPQLRALLGIDIVFAKTIEEARTAVREPHAAVLLDNVRQWPGEEGNEASFAAQLAEGFDWYVNNAFAVCHREHASVAAVTAHVPAYAGLLVEQEVAKLSEAVDAPAQGKVLVMGGAKASTKVPVIQHLINRSQAVLVGGILAIDVMKVRGEDIGNSRFDEDAEELIGRLDLDDARLHVARDSVTSDGVILDIGAETIEDFSRSIAEASYIIWNGPLGKFEDAAFAKGTRAIADAIVNSSAFSLIGGGDTIAAVHGFGLLDRFGHVCTGGGAMLAFLAGQQLPGLVPLNA